MINPIKYQYRKTVVLTPSEGEKLEQLLKQKGLDNVSQLVKQLVNTLVKEGN